MGTQTKNTAAGLRIGTAASQKLGFHGALPTVQAAFVAAPVATAATSSTPFGFTQTQADALIACVRAMQAALVAKGIMAAS